MSKVAGGNKGSGDPIRVFLSYRRSDDRHFVGRFHDRLTARYGEANVFMDIDSIHAGSNFSDVIAQQVGMVDAVIVLIGATWATRLHQDGDLVRMEVAASIAADCAVVPIVIEDTPIPSPNSLPDDVGALLHLNITRVRGGVDFHRDTTRALEGLDVGVATARRRKSEQAMLEARRLREQKAAERATRRPPADRPGRGRIIAGVAALAAVALVSYALWPSGSASDSAATSSAASTTGETTTLASSTATTVTATPVAADNVLAVLERDFPAFAALVLQDEESAEYLADTRQKSTVFAPSDTALEGVSEVLGDSEIAAFVKYHIISEDRTAQEMAGKSYRTREGQEVLVNREDSGVLTIGSVTTLVNDGVEAGNGRVIEIDAPLWSPSLGERPDELVVTVVPKEESPSTTGGSTATTATATTVSGATSLPQTTSATSTTTSASGFSFTSINPNSATVTAGTETTIQATVSWTGAPNGGEYLCIGRSEKNVQKDAGGYPLAYMAQSGSCSTVGSTNGSGTITLLIGGNFAGTATYTLYDAEGRASGSKTFTITVVP